jgi:hypothetical protein
MLLDPRPKPQTKGLNDEWISATEFQVAHYLDGFSTGTSEQRVRAAAPEGDRASYVFCRDSALHCITKFGSRKELH